MFDEFYQARKKLVKHTTEDLGISKHSPQKIYINESLTRRNKSLLNRCMEIKKEQKYRFLWTKYGKILMRKDGDSPVITITSVKDLEEKLLGHH